MKGKSWNLLAVFACFG